MPKDPEGHGIKLPKYTLRSAAWAENILGVAGGAILSGIIKRD